MVTLGYEQPVAMPSMGVYDTDLMKMYISGVREQYNQAQDAMNKFYDKYSDFYSTIDGDTEYFYDKTIGGASKLIDDMYAQGVDPFKNQQARGLISRYIANVPVGTLNQLRRNAENKKIYDQNKAMLISKGLFNEDLENMRLKELNLLNFKSIDGNKVNVWNELSPIEYKSLFELANPEFQKFSPTEYLGQSYNPDGTPHWGYLLRGVSKENQKKATLGAKTDIDKTVYGKFYRKQAEQQVDTLGLSLTPEARQQLIEKQFEKNILQSQAEYLQPKEEADAAFLERWKVYNSNLQNELNRRNAKDVSGIKDTDPTPSTVSYTERVNQMSTKKRNNYFKTNMATVLNKLSELYSNKEFQKKYKVAGNNLNLQAKWFKDNANNIPNLKKHGYLDDEGNPTEKFMYEYSKLLRSIPASERGKAQSDFYNTFTIPMVDAKENEAVLSYLTGTEKRTNGSEYGNIGAEYVTNMAKGGWQLTINRQSKLAGYGVNKKAKEIRDYIVSKKLNGFVKDAGNLQSRAAVPNSNGSYSVDFNYLVDIKMDQLDDFFKNRNITDFNKKVEYLKSIGATIADKYGNTIANVKDSQGNLIDRKTMTARHFVRIPVTNTLTNNFHEFGELNIAVDRALGQTFASENAYGRQAESAADGL